MSAVVWIAIVLAVLVVGGAIGIPYFLTHRRMIDHFDRDHSETYLAATGRTADDVSRGRAGRSWRPNPARRPRQAADAGPDAVADRPAETGTL